MTGEVPSERARQIAAAWRCTPERLERLRFIVQEYERDRARRAAKSPADVLSPDDQEAATE